MAFDKKVSYFLNKYLTRIKSLYAPDEMWLWGSRAYGSPGEFSDIDLIVVSDTTRLGSFGEFVFVSTVRKTMGGSIERLHDNRSDFLIERFSKKIINKKHSF